MNERPVLGPRFAVVAAIPVLAAIGVTLLSIVMMDELPDQLATHWSGSTADGFMAVETLAAINSLMILALGLGFVLAAPRMPGRVEARTLTAAGTGLAAFLAVLHIGTLLANRGTDGVDVSFPSATLAAAAVIGLGVAALGWRLGPDGRGTGPEFLASTELTMDTGEAVVWTGAASAERWFLLLPAVMIGFAAWMAVAGDAFAAVTALGAAIAALSLLRVRVSIGAAGVRVRGGPFGLLRTRVPLEQITSVRAEQVEPMAYGGWGYRIKPGVRAITIRSGPGLHIEREGKPDLVITVDGAQEAAGVLQAHLRTRA